MAFNRPSLLDLINRTRNDIVSRLPGIDILRRHNAEVYARALSGAAHGLYGFIDWLSRQLIYDTAEGDWLERWASIWGIARKASAVATGSVTFTGSNGAVIPSGTALSAYDGLLYETSDEGAIASGSAVVAVAASSAGVAGNRAAGQTFTLQSPISGITATAVAGAMTGGTDIENDDSLRGRLLSRIKQPPQGGSKADYSTWALAVAGVTRAWVYPLELGAGTVIVRFMMDGTYVDGIPLAGDVTAVSAYIDPLRPVTAAVTVVAPIPDPLDFTISGLTPSTAAVKAAITQALVDLIAREAEPGGTTYLSHYREAISGAAGESDHVLTTPVANVTAATGHITVMGTITWA